MKKRRPRRRRKRGHCNHTGGKSGAYYRRRCAEIEREAWTKDRTIKAKAQARPRPAWAGPPGPACQLAMGITPEPPIEQQVLADIARGKATLPPEAVRAIFGDVLNPG